MFSSLLAFLSALAFLFKTGLKRSKVTSRALRSSFDLLMPVSLSMASKASFSALEILNAMHMFLASLFVVVFSFLNLVYSKPAKRYNFFVCLCFGLSV